MAVTESIPVTLPAALLGEMTAACGARVEDHPEELGRRKEQRIALGCRATLSRNKKGLGLAGPTLIRDLSASGVGLLHDEKLPLGEPFAMSVHSQSGGEPVTVQCLTKRCEAGGSGGFNFIIGASFVELASSKPIVPDGSATGTWFGATLRRLFSRQN